MRSCFAFVLVLLSGCGARTIGLDESEPVSEGGALHFPEGTWSHCVEGGENAAGDVFHNRARYVIDAQLKLTREGTVLTAKYLYVDMPIYPLSLTFTGTSSASAELELPAKGFHGPGGWCPGDDVPSFSSQFTAESGTLSHASGTAFLSIAGTLEGDGPCGYQSSPERLWLVCSSSASPETQVTPTAMTTLQSGTRACRSQTLTELANQGSSYADGLGSLEVTRSGSSITATYSGDPSISGTLHLLGTSATTARSTSAGSGLLAVCQPGASTSPEPFTSLGAALSVTGSTMQLLLSGVQSSSATCPAAHKVVSITCPP